MNGVYKTMPVSKIKLVNDSNTLLTLEIRSTLCRLAMSLDR
jgi:hypothetical protein